MKIVFIESLCIKDETKFGTYQMYKNNSSISGHSCFSSKRVDVMATMNLLMSINIQLIKIIYINFFAFIKKVNYVYRIEQINLRIK